ncbi:SLOG family protein [Rhizobium leguminosarum]
MKLLICGGRDMSRADAFNWLCHNVIDELCFASGCYSGLLIEKVIHGGCRGADEGAGDWAKSEHIPVVVCPANWKKHGKAAGPIRNREMLETHKPDYVIALPGGKGTANMISLAEASGVPVIRAK